MLKSYINFFRIFVCHEGANFSLGCDWKKESVKKKQRKSHYCLTIASFFFMGSEKIHKRFRCILSEIKSSVKLYCLMF